MPHGRNTARRTKKSVQHTGQAIASARKRESRTARETALIAEAAGLGISVDALKTRKFGEVQKIRRQITTISGEGAAPVPERGHIHKERGAYL